MFVSFLPFAVPLSLTLLVREVDAAISNSFQQPNINGLNVTAGTNFTVRWFSDFGDNTTVTLTVYQQNPYGGWFGKTLLDSVPDPSAYNWTALPFKGLTIEDGFHFNLLLDSTDSPKYSPGANFSSGALFINDDYVAASVTASSSSAFPTGFSTATLYQVSTTFPTSIRSTSSTPSPSSPSAATGQAQSNKGLSSGTKIGLGVGIGVGIPLLLLLVGMCVVIYRLHRKVATQPSTRNGANKEGWTKAELPAHSTSRKVVKPSYELP